MNRIGRIAALFLFSIAATLAAQVNVPDAEQLVGTPRGAPLAGEQLAQRTQQVAGEIRCPVCQGLSVADSPSEMAVNMKAQVRALLARGYTEPQIEKYFERSYGQFVLLRPKFEGVNSLVWIFPIAAMAAGVLIVIFKIRNLKEVQP
jgi:cytochrome c-type biogenesis protein CcmH